MKFRKTLFIIASALLVFTACNKSKDLSNAIPSDAAYIINTDTKALVEKSKYNIFENPSIKQTIDLGRIFLKDQDKINLLDEFLKNTNSIGLDLKDELYIYTNYKTLGLIIGVNDAKKFKDVLVSFGLLQADDIKKDGDIYTATLQSKVSIAWDSNKLIILGDMTSSYNRQSNSDNIDIAELAIKQLKQGTENSINTNKSYKEFINNKKDISVFYSMKGIANMMDIANNSGFEETNDIATAKKILDGMTGISVGGYTSFDKGEIKFQSKYYYDSPEDEKKFKDEASKMAGTIKGNYLKYITSNPLLMATINVKGDGIYNFLNQMGIENIAKEEFPAKIQPLQLQQLIENFNGDITFALTSINQDTKKLEEIDEITGESFEDEIKITVPQCLLFADLKDPDYLLSFLKNEMDSNKVEYTKIDPTTFSISEGGIKMYFGTRGKSFFFTNIESAYNNLDGNGLKNNYADQIKDKTVLVSGDIKMLKPYIESQNTLIGVLPILNEISEYSITTSADNYSVDGRLDFTNKDKNSLAIICEQLDKVIDNLGSSMNF